MDTQLPTEKFLEEFKEIYGNIIDLAFLMRNPLLHNFDNTKYALEIEKEDDSTNRPKLAEDPFRIRVWLNNTPTTPGEFSKQFIIDLYQKTID